MPAPGKDDREKYSKLRAFRFDKGETLSTRLKTMCAVAIAIVAVTAVGCGGGSDSTSSSSSAGGGTSSSAEGGSSSLSKEEFVKQANAACLEARENSFAKIAAYEQHHRSQGLPQPILTQNAVRAVLLSTIEAEIPALRALGAPAGEEEKVEAMLAAQQAALEKAQKLRNKHYSLQAAKGFQASVEIENDFGGPDKEFVAYGLTSCIKKGE